MIGARVDLHILGMTRPAPIFPRPTLPAATDRAAEPIETARHPWVVHRRAAGPRLEVDHRRGGSVPIDLARVREGAVEVRDPASPSFCMVMGHTAATGAFEVNHGDGWRRLQSGPSVVEVPPMGSETHYRHPDCAYDFVALDAQAMLRWIGDGATGRRLLDEVLGREHVVPLAREIFDLVWQAAGHGADGDLTVEAGVMLLLSSLLDGLDHRRLEPAPRLADKRLARVVDYIETHLADRILVEELAGVAHISVYHFTRAFRSATGLTPHRYVMARRVVLAKQLLLQTNDDITTIAMACGFASHSHMTEVFRRHVGAPPSAWRANA